MGDVFWGYHSEWNLGSPGGWEYQRMTQGLGRLAWKKIQKHITIPVELDFDHPLLNPVPGFVDMLLRAHRQNFGTRKPFLVLVAEEDTLEKVVENHNIVKHLNGLPGVKAALAAPHWLEEKNGTLCLEGEEVTVIFMDFNNNVLLKTAQEHDVTPLIEAVKRGLVVNPRGMEPVGAKGVFELVTGDLKDDLSPTTVSRTPWTRKLRQRRTSGPRGEEIENLVTWVREHWTEIILKPEHGYSGKGIIVGVDTENRDEAIQKALDSGDYIAQAFVPPEKWAEDYPWLDHTAQTVVIKTWQTDFRCFITDAGLIGFVGRFGGIPTNVGSGGGVQSLAVLKSDMPLTEANKRINDAVVTLRYDVLAEIQECVNEKAVEVGLTYLLGPIMTALKPRLLTYRHLEELEKYASNLWRDAVKIEQLWREGALEKIVDISDEEKALARMHPWNGSPALIASDGLFSFSLSMDQ